MSFRRVALVIILFLVFAVLVQRMPQADVPSAVVRAGSLGDIVVESGTLTAAHMRVYSAPVGVAQAKIIDLVPEGTLVKAGDRLMRFDSTDLERDRSREMSLLQEAQAEQLRVRDELRVEQLRAESDAASAQDRLNFAEQAVADQVDGKGRVDLAEASSAAADAAAEAARARKAYDDLTPLLAKGFITRAELERAQQAAGRAENAAKLANLRAQAVSTFERPAAIAKARAELSTARADVSRQRDVAAAHLQQAAAAAALADARVAECATRIDSLKAQIAASVVLADGPGFAMYRDAYFGGDHRKPQVGDQVSPNQPILAVPDASRILVDTRVREVDVRRVAAGQPATVILDALPDVRVRATVSLVGALAIEDPSRAGTRFFPVTVTVDGSDARLRPGMSARVEFEGRAAERAAIVPLAAVFDAEGEPYCLVISGGRIVRRSVVVASTTDSEAALRSGVHEGERVALLDPDAIR